MYLGRRNIRIHRIHVKNKNMYKTCSRIYRISSVCWEKCIQRLHSLKWCKVWFTCECAYKILSVWHVALNVHVWVYSVGITMLKSFFLLILSYSETSILIYLVNLHFFYCLEVLVYFRLLISTKTVWTDGKVFI